MKDSTKFYLVLFFVIAVLALTAHFVSNLDIIPESNLPPKKIQKLTPEEKVEKSRMEKICSRLLNMTPGSFVTLEFKEENVAPTVETYVVKKTGYHWATIVGPGPGSKIFEQEKLRINSFFKIVRPDANPKVIDVHRPWVDEEWQTLMTWWALQ